MQLNIFLLQRHEYTIATWQKVEFEKNKALLIRPDFTYIFLLLLLNNYGFGSLLSLYNFNKIKTRLKVVPDIISIINSNIIFNIYHSSIQF